MDRIDIDKHRTLGFSPAQWSKSEQIMATPDVQSRINQACTSLGNEMAAMLHDHIQRQALLQTPFESPLEVIFYAWWEGFEAAWAHMMWHNVSGPSLSLLPQQWVEVEGQRFRLDFKVQPWLRGDGEGSRRDLFPKIAIELDGHDFHEKTKEQVTRRNTRDRLLQQHGWRVFHVSGSELVTKPLETTREIHEHCRKEYDDFRFKVYEATT